jgi:hypothetical protein
MKNAAEHTVKNRGYKEEDVMTPEMKNKVKIKFVKIDTSVSGRVTGNA